MVMNSDGTIPRDWLDGPTIGPGVTSGYTHLALAPDEKSVYFCGLASDEYGKTRQNVVSRVGLGVDYVPEIIFGTVGKALAGQEGLTDPRGVAVDHEGRVYVSDFGNDRIVVLDPAGKYLGDLAVKGAEAIAVLRRPGRST